MIFVALLQARGRSSPLSVAPLRSLFRTRTPCLERANATTSLIRRSFVSSTHVCLEEENTAGAKSTTPSVDISKVVHEYNRKKANYKKQVSKLRKQYAEEVAAQRAADEAEAAARRAVELRNKWERQRHRNIRSANHALKERERREARAREFEEHLRQEQMKRDASKALFQKARQMVIDELEEQAHLWLTTPEEVEAAFTAEVEQRLWARPHGVLGETHPSVDTHYWAYQAHYWNLNKTYLLRREALLEAILQYIFDRTNIDDSYWTEDRLAERTKLEEKARLRGMIQDEGRRILLKKQHELMSDLEPKEGELPRSKPVPDVSILANVEAMEAEGVRALMNDPTDFFVFENTTNDASGDNSAKESSGDAEDVNIDSADSAVYNGPTLGAPIGLKKKLSAFQRPIGKFPKKEKRSAREKKRQEREQRLAAAAQAEQMTSKNEIGMDDDMDMGVPASDIDYDNSYWDSDDEEWEQGLDPVQDSERINADRSFRFKTEDIEWVMERLKNVSSSLEKEIKYFLRTKKAKIVAMQRIAESSGKRLDTSTGHEGLDLEGLGVDVDRLNKVIASLSEDQLFALSLLDDLDTSKMSADEIRKALGDIPDLTDAQIQDIMRVESTLSSNDELRKFLVPEG